MGILINFFKAINYSLRIRNLKFPYIWLEILVETIKISKSVGTIIWGHTKKLTCVCEKNPNFKFQDLPIPVTIGIYHPETITKNFGDILLLQWYAIQGNFLIQSPICVISTHSKFLISSSTPSQNTKIHTIQYSLYYFRSIFPKSP